MSESVAAFPAAVNEDDRPPYQNVREEPKDVGGVAGARLKAFIERIERLEEEKAVLMEDIKEVYGEMKATGFDTKAVRKIVAMRKKDQAERQEEEAIIDLYKNALGMV